jgi:hypothetical protein
MNGIFASYLWTTVLGKRILNIFESCNFSRENTNIDVSVFMVDLPIFIKGFVYQCRSGLENMNVTTFLMT